MTDIACCPSKPCSKVGKLFNSLRDNTPEQKNDKETDDSIKRQLWEPEQINSQEANLVEKEDKSNRNEYEGNTKENKINRSPTPSNKIYFRNGIEVHLEPLIDKKESNTTKTNLENQHFYPYVFGGFLIFLLGITLLFGELLYVEYEKYSFICFGTLAIVIVCIATWIMPDK